MIFQQGRRSVKDTLFDLGFDGFNVVNEGTNGVGRHVVLEKHHVRHRLLIRPPDRSKDCGYVVLPDASLETRIAAITAFHSPFESMQTAFTRLRMAPSDYQRRRLTLMLKVLDCVHPFTECSATMREIASNIVFPGADLGRAIEWKSSSMRRQTQRLVHDARHLVRIGYRSLLRGQMGHAISRLEHATTDDTEQ